MPDSILLFPPGYQITDAGKTPVSGAVLSFFDSDTTHARTVYSDSAISTSLGTSITCNSAGRPASGGNEVLVYASEGGLSITAKTPAGVKLWSMDDVNGALDTTLFTVNTLNVRTPVSGQSTNYTVTAADAGTLINVNTFLADVTISLPAAAIAGDGFTLTIRNISTGRVTIDANLTETIDGELTQNLINKYESIVLVCDASNWHIASKSNPIPTDRVPVLTVIDRDLLTPPGSPTPGDRYLLTATGAGDWASFADGAVLESNGVGGWIDYTPEAGWLAWAQDEARMLQYDGADWEFVSGQILLTSGAAATDTDTSIVFGSDYGLFRELQLELHRLDGGLTEGQVAFQVATDTAGVTYATDGRYRYTLLYATSALPATATSGDNTQTAHAFFSPTTVQQFAGTPSSAHVSLKMRNHASTARFPSVSWLIGYNNGADQLSVGSGHGWAGIGGTHTNNRATGLRWFLSIGTTPVTTVDSEWSLYGIV